MGVFIVKLRAIVILMGNVFIVVILDKLVVVLC